MALNNNPLALYSWESKPPPNHPADYREMALNNNPLALYSWESKPPPNPSPGLPGDGIK